MNTLFIILLVIAAIIALPLILALFVKKDYHIEEQVTISKRVPEVFNYIKLVRNQEHYSKWVMADPNMKKTLTGTDGTPGFIYAWDSTDNNVGAGAQEITALHDNTLNTEIRFIRPFQGTSYVTMKAEPSGSDDTRVTWSMAGKSKYPMNIMNLFMGKMLHRDMQISLQNLRNILENTI